MDFVELRALMALQFAAVSQRRGHADQDSLCARLRVPLISRESVIPDGPPRSKAQRMKGSLAAVTDEELPSVAERLLIHEPPDASERNAIQDLLWSNMLPKVKRKCRNEVLDRLDAARVDWNLDDQAPGLRGLLVDLFDLQVMSDDGRFRYLSEEIEQHFYRNPDWSFVELLRRVGAETCSDRRFVLLLEGLCSSQVMRQVEGQREVARVINAGLDGSGLRLDEVGEDDGGYPRFVIGSAHEGVRGAPKNIIFGGERPDLVFEDGVNNDVRIVITKNEEKVFIYDRPIPATGLRWRDLRDWWMDREKLTDSAQASRSLYKRLKDSMPNSPPQRVFFETFYQTYKGRSDDLPALVPEVWLHFDPAMQWQRRERELPRFRMDFLMLISHAVRVVIEADGVQHYADEHRTAQPGQDSRTFQVANREKYAEMVAEDRRLRLRGYQLYRFGGLELTRDGAPRVVADFFEELFKRHPSALQSPG